MTGKTGVLVIRADAGPQIGGGHIMRCLALASEWMKGGGKVIFVSRCESSGLANRIRNSGAGLVTLERSHPDPTDLEIILRTSHEANLEASDASDNWVILDGYHFDPEYQLSIRKAGFRRAIIDDTAHQPYYFADMIINQNIYANSLTYHCDPITRLLLGTRYVLLRPEFLKWRSHKREIPDRARKILVTMGSADPKNMTLRVLRALARLSIPDLDVKAVIGPANRHAAVLAAETRDMPFSTEVVSDPKDMPALMAWADVAIVAGGTTVWETSYMGLPAVIIEIADNQRGNVAFYARHRLNATVPFAARHDVAVIREQLTAIVRDRQWRTTLSIALPRLVDGHGASRVVEAMKSRGGCVQ